jgi:cbb3-type cytochrome oxidase subunit 3
MRKERTLFFIGIWVGLLPFLGFPNSWRKVLFVISGCAIVYLAYLFRQENKARLALLQAATEDQVMESFIDNINDIQ